MTDVLITPKLWSDERVAKLKSLWADGLSASQIAERLGSTTRNAVIGKMNRLGLSDCQRADILDRRPRVSAEERAARLEARRIRRNEREKARRAATPKLRGWRGRVFGNLALVEEPFEARCVELSAEYQTGFFDLMNESCRYAVNDASPYIFCGIPEADFNNGVSYCRGHHALVYRRG